jgi:prolyl-tRNA editing enzyme YbaK/EbsC (Cys-tRNA(Pro) deacylase)
MSAAPFKAATRRVQAALASAGIDAEIVRVAETARTAEGAAEAVGATVGQIVKSLVFLSDGAPVLALVSGANRLDLDKLAAQTGGAISRADADAVRQATGYAIGGVPPFGHATELAVYCDRDLLTHDTVWAAGGTPDTVFAVAPRRLAEATGATVCNLAAAPDGQSMADP